MAGCQILTDMCVCVVTVDTYMCALESLKTLINGSVAATATTATATKLSILLICNTNIL